MLNECCCCCCCVCVLLWHRFFKSLLSQSSGTWSSFTLDQSKFEYIVNTAVMRAFAEKQRQLQQQRQCTNMEWAWHSTHGQCLHRSISVDTHTHSEAFGAMDCILHGLHRSL